MKRSLGIFLFSVIALLIVALGWQLVQTVVGDNSTVTAGLSAPTDIPTPIPGGVYVDAASDLGEVSRYAFGSNFGPTMTVPFDLFPQFQNSGLTFLRFPAGNWGDLNDLEFSQIDWHMTQAAMIHADILFSVRLKGGTPERAAELVRYCKEKNYPVRYWNIGNEPNLFDTTGTSYGTDRFNLEWRKFALAMEAVDPNILLVGPEVSQSTGDPATDPKDYSGRDWLREFLRANGDMVDVVSVHRYPFPVGRGGSIPTPGELMADAHTWSGIVRSLRAAIREELNRDLPIGITEFNSNWANGAGGKTTPDSHLNAIWLADVMGQLIRERVDLLNYWNLQTPNNMGGHGLLGAFEVRPTYYVFQIYKQFGRRLLQASSDDPDLSIYAARLDDGTLTLVMVNLSDQEKESTLHLQHFLPQGSAEVFLLDETHPLELQDGIPAGETFGYSLPAYSAVLIKIPGAPQG